MKLTVRQGSVALAGLATLALVGCGSGGDSMNRPAGTILQAANEQALSSSFQLAFTAQVQVDLSRVTGLTGVASGDLSLAQAEINSARFSGVIQVQSQKQFELSFTLSPLLTRAWHVIDLNGSEYISENGTQWHTVPSGQSGLAGVAGGSLSNLKAEAKSWGQDLRSAATVTNLGKSTIGGAQVEQIQTTIAGSDLNHSLATILGDVATQLGSEGASLNAELPAIERLLQFTQVKSDSYVVASTGQLARTDITVGLNLDLGALSELAPGQSGLPTGSVSMTLSVFGNFSDYGKDFNIQKPSDIVSGPLPTPSGLTGALSQA